MWGEMLVFFPEFFFWGEGAKSVVMQISLVILIWIKMAETSWWPFGSQHWPLGLFIISENTDRIDYGGGGGG